MKSEHKFVEVLKEMMAETPLEEISVLALTKKCGLNRQSFYYYFHDIYDLLSLVFLSEKVEGIEASKNYIEMVTCIFRYYQKNEKFINATLVSSGKDLFAEFMYNLSYQSTMRFINNIAASAKLSLQWKKVIARYYAAGYSNLLVSYFASPKSKSLYGLIECFQFLDDDDLNKSVQNMVKKTVF